MVARQQDSTAEERSKAGPPALWAAQYIPSNILKFRLATNPDLRDLHIDTSKSTSDDRVFSTPRVRYFLARISVDVLPRDATSPLSSHTVVPPS